MSELGAEDIGHSAVGASGAHRWMNCSGSNQLITKLDSRQYKKAGFAAAEGTAAHTLLSDCMNEGNEPWEYAGTMIAVEDWSGFKVDEDMVSAVNIAYTYNNKIIAEHWRDNPAVFVEQSVRHPDYPDLFGTLDFGVVVHKRKKLYIHDYKHGVGVNVEPTSPQVQYYALVLIADIFRGMNLEDYDVELTIIQPRQPHHKGPIRTHNTTVKELLVWFKEELLPAYEATKDPNATLMVGEWCGFCPASDNCPAIKSIATSMDTDQDPTTLTGDELGALLSKTEAVKKYLERLEELALKRVKDGEAVAGYKLVKKRANRVWKEGAEDAIVTKFGDDAYQPQSLKTPPNIEKMDGGEKFVSRWAYSPDTGYTLAADSDKRAAVKPLMDDFLDRVDAGVDV